MNWKRWIILVWVCGLLSLAPLNAQGAVTTFASPIQAGCYLARPDTCKIHVDPFSINLASGKKLAHFQLLAIRGSVQSILYDFRPDVSNPAPLTGSVYTPSSVANDFAATCSQTYMVSLQGQDTGDVSPLNLGETSLFKCPIGTYTLELPQVMR